MPTYRIFAVYSADVVDLLETEIESLKEANFLRAEYALAFGDDWSIVVEVEDDEDDSEAHEEEE